MARETARAKRDDSPLSILMIDVDHFKKFNDSHGHQAADQALRELGSRLQTHFRESDIACRYGGEEFLVALPSCNKRDAAAQAEKLRADIVRSQMGVTISVGVATLPDDGHKWEMVLRRADDALYAAKSGGRNRVQLAESPANGSAGTPEPAAISQVGAADDLL